MRMVAVVNAKKPKRKTKFQNKEQDRWSCLLILEVAKQE